VRPGHQEVLLKSVHFRSASQLAMARLPEGQVDTCQAALHLFNAFCAQTATNTFKTSQAPAAGAQITRATQGVFKRSFTTPSTQHNRKDENNQKPHKNDDKIKLVMSESSPAARRCASRTLYEILSSPPNNLMTSKTRKQHYCAKND